MASDAGFTRGRGPHAQSRGRAGSPGRRARMSWREPRRPRDGAAPSRAQLRRSLLLREAPALVRGSAAAGRLHETGPAAPSPHPPSQGSGQDRRGWPWHTEQQPQRRLILVPERRLCHLDVVKTLGTRLVYDLEMENDPGLPGGPRGITRVLRRGRQEGRRQRRRCEGTQRSGGVGFESRGRGHKPRKAGA